MKDDPIDNEEEIIGVVEPENPINSYETSLFGMNGQRFLCANCRGSSTRGARHNQYEEDKVCKKNGCKCYCQSYYVGKNGRNFIKWGEPDFTLELIDEYDRDTIRMPNPTLDKIIQTMNNIHAKLKDEGIIFSNKICTRCGISGRFEGWACKQCKIELSEKDQIIG